MARKGSKWLHRLSEIDAVTRMGACSTCGYIKLKKKKCATKGFVCGVANKQYTLQSRRRAGRKSRDQSPRSYRKHVGTVCERCGFIPQIRSQLDIHHLNGIHSDNRFENLQTLCSNCHRWVTAQARKRAASIEEVALFVFNRRSTQCQSSRSVFDYLPTRDRRQERFGRVCLLSCEVSACCLDAGVA